MANQRLLLLALMLALLLSLSLALPAQAHGGPGEQLPGPAGPWLASLIYIQLAMLPIIGIWLGRETLAAWRRQPAPHSKEI